MSDIDESTANLGNPSPSVPPVDPAGLSSATPQSDTPTNIDVQEVEQVPIPGGEPKVVSSAPDNAVDLNAANEVQTPVDVQPEPSQIAEPVVANASSFGAETAVPPLENQDPPLEADEDHPVAPDEELIHTRSRIIHVLLSLFIIFLVVGGAASAAYWYSQSGSTALRLPPLPFIDEPQSAEEIANSAGTPAETSTQQPLVSPPPDTEEVRRIPPAPPVDTKKTQETATKGGLPTSTASWKSFNNVNWNFQILYPADWYLYPRDTGALGEATMVASSPLSSLQNDLRLLDVKQSEVVVGFGVLALDKLGTQALTDYIVENSALYGIANPLTTKLGQKTLVKALSLQGDVVNYYLDQGSSVYFISIKPSVYDSSKYEKIVEDLIQNFVLNAQQ